MQISEGNLFIGNWSGRRCDAKESDIRKRVALAIVVKKEEEFLFEDGAADIAAELIEVIR